MFGIRIKTVGQLLVLREEARERKCPAVEAAINRELARHGVVELKTSYAVGLPGPYATAGNINNLDLSQRAKLLAGSATA